MNDTDHDSPPPGKGSVSRLDLFTGFVQIGLFGFGGIAAACFHIIVERRKWLSAQEYAAVLGLGQVLPGANLINMSTMVGDRYQGFSGAAMALGGLMSMPILILVLLATIYDRYSALPDVRAATLAAAAGAVGLTMGTGAKLARTILGSPAAVLIALASFTSIGLLRFPMLATVLVLAPTSLLITLWRERK